MEQPFTKFINERGNDFYRGVGQNSSQPGSKGPTFVVELTKNETEAKQLFDKYVALRLNEGYKPFNMTDEGKDLGRREVWIGSQVSPSSVHTFVVGYDYNFIAGSWEITTETTITEITIEPI